MIVIQTLWFLAVFIIPGCLLLLAISSFGVEKEKCPSPASLTETGLISFFTGYLFLTYFLYILHLFTGVCFSALNLSAFSAAFSLFIIIAFRKKLNFKSGLFSPAGYQEIFLIVSLAVIFIIYFFNFSLVQSAKGTCLDEAINILLGNSDEKVSLLDNIVGDQREGAPAFAAGFAAFFSDPGIFSRILFSFCGVMLSAFTFLTVQNIFKKRWLACIFLFISALHPYIFRLSVLDENLFSLTVSSFLIYLLFLKQETLVLLTGFVYACLFNIRHEAVLFLFALIFFITHIHSGRRLKYFLIPLILFLIPTFYHHYRAMGSIFSYESFPQFKQSFPHSFFGINFELKALLNFPFYDSVVRTPFNAYPTFLLWPLYMARYSGVILCSLFLAGLYALYKKERFAFTFVILWICPLYLLFSILENWDFPSKLGVILILFNGFYLLAAYGLNLISGLKFKALNILKIILLFSLTCVIIYALNSIPGQIFKPDPRYLDKAGSVRTESSDIINIEKNWLKEIRPVPAYEIVTLFKNIFEFKAEYLKTWQHDMPLPLTIEAVDRYYGVKTEKNNSQLFSINIQQYAANRDMFIQHVHESDRSGSTVKWDGSFTEFSNLEVVWEDRPVTLLINRIPKMDEIRIGILKFSPELSIRDYDSVMGWFFEPVKTKWEGRKKIDLMDKKIDEIEFVIDVPVNITVVDVINLYGGFILVTDSDFSKDGFKIRKTFRFIRN
jgi:hypothetical protein